MFLTQEQAKFLIKVTELIQLPFYAVAFFIALGGCPWFPGCSEKLVSFSAWVFTYGLIGSVRLAIKWPIFSCVLPKYEGQAFESWIIKGIILFFDWGWVILWNVFGIIILFQEPDECTCGDIPFRSLTLAAVIIQSVCTVFVISLGAFLLCSKNDTGPLLALIYDYCTNCNSNLNTTDKFCPSCGAKCEAETTKV